MRSKNQPLAWPETSQIAANRGGDSAVLNGFDRWLFGCFSDGNDEGKITSGSRYFDLYLPRPVGWSETETVAGSGLRGWVRFCGSI